MTPNPINSYSIMKKKLIPIALIIALFGASTTSCLGSFSLSHKLLSWNQQVGDKIVNELVFIGLCILPVYEVSLLADVIVLNSIEFWSGDNPVAKGKKIIDGEDGRYMVECDGKGYTITSQTDGRSMRLDFDAVASSWSVALEDGSSYELMTFVDANHVSMPAADGSRVIVPVDEAGLMAYRASVPFELMAAK